MKSPMKSPLKSRNTKTDDYIISSENPYKSKSTMYLREIIDKIVALERDEAEYKQKLSRTKNPAERSGIELKLKANAAALSEANR